MTQRDALLAGRYRLVERVGVGGMGSVWEAHDERLKRTVAVKLLHPRPGMSEADAQVAKDRAMREARITARLHHPHAVPVFDVVEHEGQPCLIMQYLPSRTLQEVLAEKRTLPPDEVALIGAEVASALAAAHAAGIVHRDVKPANVLITEDGSAMITDFGISHALGDAALTSTGLLTGTPAYLAPEIARGSTSSPASDVFSLGATLYTALEGIPPFGSDDNAMALLHRVASGTVTPPTRAAGLTPVLMRMLADDPEDRPAMDEVARELETLELSDAATPTTVLPVTAPAPAVSPAPRPVGPTSALPVAASVPPDPAPPAPAGPADDDHPGPEPPARQRRTAAILVALVLILALAAFMAVQTLGGEDPVTTPTTTTTSTATTGTATTAPASPTSTAVPTETPTPPPAPTTSASPTSTPPSPAPSTAPEGPTPGTLAKAVTDYYALLPDDTETGYSLLTDRFRRDKAGSFESYDAFWDDFDEVTATDAVGTPPGTVEATITYTLNDGRVIVERTAFTLVENAGVLKIDRTQVLDRLSP